MLPRAPHGRARYTPSVHPSACVDRQLLAIGQYHFLEAKDLLAVKGYKTTFGASPFKDQTLDVDSSVYVKLTDAGAVLVAKLTLGALAMGDRWFGGQTKSPWDPTNSANGSSGSSMSASLIVAPVVSRA